MKYARAVLSFFGIHVPPSPVDELKRISAALDDNIELARDIRRTLKTKPRAVFTPVGSAANTYTEPVAEVDNVRERYSAARYVEALKSGMNGDYTGRAEWQRHLLTLPQDDVRLFFYEVDQLVEAGALVHVLTEEETAQVKQRVLDKVEEYREAAKGAPMPIDPAFVNAIVNDPDAEIELEMDESEAEAWLEDIEEGDTHGQEDDEEAREGQEDEEQGRSDEEGRVLS